MVRAHARDPSYQTPVAGRQTAVGACEYTLPEGRGWPGRKAAPGLGVQPHAVTPSAKRHSRLDGHDSCAHTPSRAHTPSVASNPQWNRECMERMELCDKKRRISLSTHVPAFLTSAEDTTTSPDVSMTRIRDSLTEDGVRATKKLLHVLVMNVRGTALAVIRGLTNMIGALAW